MAMHLSKSHGVLAAALVLITLATTWTATAQTKKDDKAAPAAKEPKKEQKKEPKFVDIMVGTGGGHEQVAMINQLLEKSWQDNKITPSERCTDYEFIRRASLDIIGRIATLKEIQRFLADPPARRRSMLIERLLGNEEFIKGNEYEKGFEYAHNWSNMWTVLLMTRTSVPKKYQQQMRDWLTDKFLDAKADKKDERSKTYIPDWSAMVTEILTAQGDTDENGAVNFILAHLGDPVLPKDAKANGKFDMVPLTSRTTRLFLGLRTQCVQCHDHPFSGDWLQSHFWGINAFFRQVAPSDRPAMMAKKKDKMDKSITLKDDPSLNPKGLVSYERRSGVLLFTDATFLDGTKMPSIKDYSTDNRRKELAKFIVKSPYFAKSFVNRTWGHFFGRSFTKDNVDDFGEHNPITHTELFEKLSEDWAKKYNHNPKMLIRWICNSRAYGLSSIANSKNDKLEDEVFFARMLQKPMSPEQLFDSLMTATEAKAGDNKVTKGELRDKWLDKLIVRFGDDEGNEGSFNGTVVQALLLMNGKDINDAIADPKFGTVAVALRENPPTDWTKMRKMLDTLFMAALNRPPTAKEVTKILDPATYSGRQGGIGPQNLRDFTWYSQDIFWALLNSNEFILNH
jgi:hypothetical protein